MDSLYDRLVEYVKSDVYPFHMPGHKRNPKVDFFPCQMDITEIDGFDNLYDANELLLLAQQQAASLYGSQEAFFLVNGSTVGILTAVSAVCKENGKIIMARNCHKAAYHAAFLKKLDICYVYPKIEPNYHIQGGITPEAVLQQLEEHPDAQAVFITSPTYDGIVSDIARIAKIVHAFGIPLIVDEAHGAHFGFLSGKLPDSSVHCGADIVIQSMHKTLPSMTQTALMHVNGESVDRRSLKKYLQIYQTSSPSYVMMTGMEKCIQMLKEQSRVLFEGYVNQMEELYRQLCDLKNLRVFRYTEEMRSSGIIAADISKVLIFTDKTSINGKKLYDLLRERYHLQFEMAAEHYALAMTSIMDTSDGFVRLRDALFEIDEELSVHNSKRILGDTVCTREVCTINIEEKHAPVIRLKLSDAEEAPCKMVALQESFDMISAEYVYLYPPGIPLLVPGEIITESIIFHIQQYIEKGLTVEGMEDKQKKTILVVDS